MPSRKLCHKPTFHSRSVWPQAHCVTEEHEFRLSNSLVASDAVPTHVQARWFRSTDWCWSFLELVRRAGARPPSWPCTHIRQVHLVFLGKVPEPYLWSHDQPPQRQQWVIACRYHHCCCANFISLFSRFSNAERFQSCNFITSSTWCMPLTVL